MLKKPAHLKPHINKDKATLPKQYKNRLCLSLCLSCFCVLCVFLNLSCDNSSAPPAPPENNNESSSVKNDDATLSGQSNVQCDNLANRIDELDALILRQEQAAKQAATQANESCQDDSAIDCGFWTERASSLSRQIRELHQQRRKLTSQKTQNGCQ